MGWRAFWRGVGPDDQNRYWCGHGQLVGDGSQQNGTFLGANTMAPYHQQIGVGLLGIVNYGTPGIPQDQFSDGIHAILFEEGQLFLQSGSNRFFQFRIPCLL